MLRSACRLRSNKHDFSLGGKSRIPGARANSAVAALGLRSNRPPDSLPDPNQPPPISDQEWDLRTGRAIFVLQETLPHFFTTGLVTSIDHATGSPIPARIVQVRLPGTSAAGERDKEDPSSNIYSSNIRLSYTPPVELPAPLPKTLNIEGMPMYLASAVFVRHTMHALYSDLRVVLNKVSVVAPPPSTTRHSREKTLSIGLSATGVARVSGAAGEWEVNSTYTFSPLTGLIHIHTINSIHPAPHQAVYDSLRASLGTMFGAPQPSQTGKPTTCARKASSL